MAQALCAGMRFAQPPRCAVCWVVSAAASATSRPAAEKELLRRHAAEIAGQVPAGGVVVVELGCGDSTKSAIQVEALLARWAGGRAG